eukprot:Filipodium_phascolosomae@DN2397_c0_g1_i7.p1
MFDRVTHHPRGTYLIIQREIALLGFGFVLFENPEIVPKLVGMREIKGKQVEVKAAMKVPPPASNPIISGGVGGGVGFAPPFMYQPPVLTNHTHAPQHGMYMHKFPTVDGVPGRHPNEGRIFVGGLALDIHEGNLEVGKLQVDVIQS